jgi:hypothetical protein
MELRSDSRPHDTLSHLFFIRFNRYSFKKVLQPAELLKQPSLVWTEAALDVLVCQVGLLLLSLLIETWKLVGFLRNWFSLGPGLC